MAKALNSRIKYYCPKCKKEIKRIDLVDSPEEKWICEEHGELKECKIILK